MKHIIVGTAGHVDHGKTTLIRALTGTDTDRLKEEQERGMTIDLGFAALTLPDGTPAGIVDVPGHERFLKNMLAGAAGIDVVLLVIAADESVMPQTVEHLDILRLLDVKNGVVALTKIDMVDPEWLEVVEEDIRGRLEGTFLERAPIVRVDSVHGKGIQELKKALLSAVSRTEQKNTALPFRLPVDRVFTRPGFGTVITGTLVAGTMKVGDSVDILPMRLASRVRGLQSHGKKQECVEAGTRVAVNLAGVETTALERGALLAAPGTLEPTQIFDATLTLLPSAPRPLANRARVRVYLGTAEILGRVQVIGTETIEPGKKGFVQFRAEEPFACARGDRFVVRSYSPMVTIAGGTVLDSAPRRHKRMDPGVVALLEAKERGTPDDLLVSWLAPLPLGGPGKEAARALGLTDSEIREAEQSAIDRGSIVQMEGGRLIHAGALTTAADRALNALNAWHAANPLRPGMPKEELRSTFGKAADSRAFSSLLAWMQAEGRVTTDGTTVRSTEFAVQLNPRQQALLDRIALLYRDAGYNTPSIEEASQAVGAPPDAVAAMIRVGQDQGIFEKLADGLYYHRDTWEKAKRIVREQVAANGSVTVSQFRDVTGSSRKYALPVMEHMDAVRFTRRVGDARTLVDPAE
jgi:selenocysteine-specific elongation factor